MRKILIISYFFPPSAKAGAHRPYSMGEFLPRFGWHPIFIAPEKGYYGRIPRYDEKLLNFVSKFPILRIPHYYPFNNDKKSLIARAARKIWETLLFPDGKLLWNKEIKKRLEQIIIEYKPNAVFITGTPFSSFLISPYIKADFGLPVILDYRDPWLRNLYLERSKWKEKFAISAEKKLLTTADLITAASYYMVDYIKELYVEDVKEKKFFGFPYGYNGEFFRKEIFSIPVNEQHNYTPAAFAGSVHGNIDVELVLSGIRQAIENNMDLSKNLKIRCFGSLFGCTYKAQDLIRKYRLENYITLHSFVSYKEFVKILYESSFLILPHGESKVAKVLYPTKLFDYLGVKRPILYVGGKGQVWETILDCNAGICSLPNSDDIEKSLIEIFIKRYSKKWYNKIQNYKKLDRSYIFAKFCNKLDELVS